MRQISLAGIHSFIEPHGQIDGGQDKKRKQAYNIKKQEDCV